MQRIVHLLQADLPVRIGETAVKVETVPASFMEKQPILPDFSILCQAIQAFSHRNRIEQDARRVNQNVEFPFGQPLTYPLGKTGADTEQPVGMADSKWERGKRDNGSEGLDSRFHCVVR